jgi:LysM repeat protein
MHTRYGIKSRTRRRERKSGIILAGLLLFLAVSAFAQEQIHTLQRGETIYALAKKYGVKENEILFLNGIEDARRVYVGQKIRIPNKSIQVGPIPSGVPSFIEHKVVRGETLFGLARNYNVTEAQLRAVNNLSENYVLKIGDTLRIPTPVAQPVASSAPAAPPVSSIEHKAVRGETLFGLARNYNVTETQLRAANNLSENYVLKVGDTLRIPVPAASSAQPVASPAPVRVTPPASPASLASKTVDRSLLWPVTVKDAAYMTGKLSGVVLTGTQGESVRCIAEGTVVSAGPFRGFGRVVIVQAKDGYLYVYGGQESLAVKEGDRVTSGAELGKLGVDSTTGKSDLFFMVYKSQNPIDPATAPRT